MSTASEREAAQLETQREHRERRLRHEAEHEANPAKPDADPNRIGTHEQKPDVQLRLAEHWADVAALEFAEIGAEDWTAFSRGHDLPLEWVVDVVEPVYRQAPALIGEDAPGLLEATVPADFRPQTFVHQDETHHHEELPAPAFEEGSPDARPASMETIRIVAQTALEEKLRQISIGLEVDPAVLQQLRDLAAGRL
jgi:hypothetical protein